MEVRFSTVPNDFALRVKTPMQTLAAEQTIASVSDLECVDEEKVSLCRSGLTEVGSRVLDLLLSLPGVDYVGFTGGILVGFSSAYERREMEEAISALFAACSDDARLLRPEVATECQRRLSAQKRILVERYPNERYIGIHFRRKISSVVFHEVHKDHPLRVDTAMPIALAQLLIELAAAREVRSVTVRPYEVSLMFNDGFSREQAMASLNVVARVRKALYGEVHCEVAYYDTPVDESDPADDDGWGRDDDTVCHQEEL